MNYLMMILIIGVAIVVHELGHLLVARWTGIPVSRFSIGFGRKLFGFEIGATEYRLSLFPLGGYVLPKASNESEFRKIAVGKRVLFTLGGPAFNILFCVLLFALLNFVNGNTTVYNLIILPFIQTLSTLAAFISAIPSLFTGGTEAGTVIDIVRQSEQLLNYSFSRVLEFSILLNINLAILNLLPIPPLDGGKLLLYLSEKLHARWPRFHYAFNFTGFILIMGASVYLLSKSVIRALA